MKLDRFSYHLGAADCFCEMVRAGVKRIALSHPCDSRQERDAFLPEFDRLCEKYGVSDADRKRMMGHSFGADITNGVYGHRTLEELREQIEKIRVDL